MSEPPIPHTMDSPLGSDQHITYPEPRLPTRGNGTDRSDRSTIPAVQVERPRPAPDRIPSAPRARRLLPVILGILALLAILVAGVGGWLRYSMTRALPQIDGQIAVPGLAGEVVVTRDIHGVPSITAGKLDDLLFAQGYVTAGDRLWQMDSLRRYTAGELAEVLGAGLLDHDRQQRYLQLREAADRAVAVLPADELAQLRAYARGVSGCVARAGRRVPGGFSILHYKPAPWTPRDSLLVSLSMAQALGTSFPGKLDREALSAHLPPALLADLYPVGSWRDWPPTAPARDLTAPHDVPQIPLDRSQSSLHTPSVPNARPEDLLHLALTMEHTCTDCRAGSNNWAVAASRSASGAPLLSNDMHLNLSAPDIWYEASLHVSGRSSVSDKLDVTGFTLPGVPFVIVGRNAHVAWGFTNLGGDAQDVREEHLRGAGATAEFQRTDGTWAPAGHQRERIRVRGSRDVELDVLTTTAAIGSMTIATPVISPLYPSERRPLSLAWTIYDPAVLTSPFLAVNQATDGASLVAALGSFGAPSLNLLWADSNRHIGYHAIGRIPVRGPAMHHPRAVQPLVLPDNVPVEDQKDETEPGQAQILGPRIPSSDEIRANSRTLASAYSGRQNSFSAHWMTAMYRHRPRGRARRPARRTPRPPPEIVPTPPPATVAPAAEALNYTIGSPISPVPVHALDATQIWSGYIPFSDLPAAQDPADGLLATANSRITTDDYPYALTDNWIDPYRVERISKLLEGRRGLLPADMLAVQNDIHSELDLAIARHVAYAIDHASVNALDKDGPRLREAADLLRQWTGDMRATLPAPAIVRAIRAEFWPALLGPAIVRHDHLADNDTLPHTLAALYAWGESGTATELLLQHQPARWLPPGQANWNDFLTALTEHALGRAHAPGKLAAWTYGQVHTIEIAHPLLRENSFLRSLLGVSGSSGVWPADGDGSTVKAMGRAFGPSERFIADLANEDATLGNITTGQSGQPSSPWFMDQFTPWLQGTTFALPLHGRAATHRLVLQPRPAR